MSQVLTQQYPAGMDVTSDPPYFPDVGSAAKLMEWIYRIKYWEAVFNLTTGAGAWASNGTYSWQARDAILDGVSSPTNPLPTTERDLVLDADPDSFAGSIAVSGGSGFFLRLLDRFKITVVSGSQTEWFPFMLFTAQDPSAGGSLSNTDDSVIIGGTPRASAATMTVDGFSVPLYEPVDVAPNTWFGTIDITPIEWWPYAPTSGGLPVFDSATGAQINPNVVID